MSGTQTIGLSHFDCFYVVYEVHTLLTDHFERYFNIIDGQTDRSNRLTPLAHTRAGNCSNVQAISVIISATTHVANHLQCDSDEWRCDDGDCIDEDDRCDDFEDCDDGSDEDDCVGECLLVVCSTLNCMLLLQARAEQLKTYILT